MGEMDRIITAVALVSMQVGTGAVVMGAAALG